MTFEISNNKVLAVMVFYSALTFAVGPKLTSMFLGEEVIGMLLGFVVSLLLWKVYGREWATDS